MAGFLKGTPVDIPGGTCRIDDLRFRDLIFSGVDTVESVRISCINFQLASWFIRIQLPEIFIKASPDQLFLADNLSVFAAASQLEPGMRLLYIDGEWKEIQQVDIIRLRAPVTSVAVFDADGLYVKGVYVGADPSCRRMT